MSEEYAQMIKEYENQRSTGPKLPSVERARAENQQIIMGSRGRGIPR